jgi:hypothetical protein
VALGLLLKFDHPVTRRWGPTSQAWITPEPAVEWVSNGLLLVKYGIPAAGASRFSVHRLCGVRDRARPMGGLSVSAARFPRRTTKPADTYASELRLALYQSRCLAASSDTFQATIIRNGCGLPLAIHMNERPLVDVAHPNRPFQIRPVADTQPGRAVTQGSVPQPDARKTTLKKAAKILGPEPERSRSRLRVDDDLRPVLLLNFALALRGSAMSAAADVLPILV